MALIKYKNGSSWIAYSAFDSIGTNITGGTANDTQDFWIKQPSGIYYFSQNNMLNGQPEQWLELFHVVQSNLVTQFAVGGSRMLMRRASTSGAMPSFFSPDYPVGAVYISYSSTSPSTLFGGTWAVMTGVFPYFNSGTGTGGSNTHTLTTAQLPSHTHALAANPSSGMRVWTYNGESAVLASGTGYAGALRYFGDLTSGSSGSGSSHNNMPAYQTFYAWRRTA